MKDLVVIIPIHEVGGNLELLKRAVASVPEDVKIVLSTVKDVREQEFDGIEREVEFLFSESCNFCDLVNFAVDNISEKWFSILEFDDEYTSIWLDNVKKYIEYKPDTSVFMVLEDIVDFKDGKYISFGNEAPLAAAFSNELGYIDNESLQNYFNFYMTGSVFNTDDWKAVGGLKPPMKVTFWYEWLLRTTNKGNKVYVIPKVGYTHRLNRGGSITETYKNTLSPDEIDGWFEIAKREYFFHPSVDRNYESVKSDEEVAEQA